MSKPYLRSALTLASLTTAGFIFAGCFGGSIPSQPSGSSGQTGSFILQYYNNYDQTGDDVGGAKTPTDVSIIWSGSRKLYESSPSSGDTFGISSTWHGYATDPWNTNTLAGNLNAGDWQLSVNVNGADMMCQSAISLPSGKTVIVTFDIDKTSGLFSGCTSYVN
jgi:hypothetical protein